MCLKWAFDGIRRKEIRTQLSFSLSMAPVSPYQEKWVASSTFGLPMSHSTRPTDAFIILTSTLAFTIGSAHTSIAHAVQAFVHSTAQNNPIKHPHIQYYYPLVPICIH